MKETSSFNKAVAINDENIIASIPKRITVDCNMIIAKDPKFLRLLSTDQCLVIPAKTPLRFLITSSDVIHS
jgi:heme/copper-type cytochrome/quinol oxidase subunit 2